ncbi:MAG: hypothetical protein MUC38_02575 [Cyclobacteriaceae bacterium]|jgi:hypothetical protein|nr:hypothetical protein [Cyclobacteriaceae bacterium]
MSHPIDQFFKEKLAEHSVPPPTNAWAAVESRVAKKRDSLGWAWRIAAALLLFALPVGVWVSSRVDPQLPPATGQNQVELSQPAADTVAPPERSPAPRAQPSQTTSTQPRGVPKTRSTEMASAAHAIAEADTASKTTVAAKAPPPETAATVAAAPAKPIVIEFTLEPVAAPVVIADKNGWQRFLEKARDVKNGEGDLGLREAADDLLARGFRKDKTKQN